MATLDARSGANDRGLVASGNTYADVVNATTANAAVEDTGDDFAGAEFFTPTYFVRRNAMEFDLTSVPAGSTISGSPTLKITAVGVTSDTNNFALNVFHFTRGSTVNTAFEANDYNEAVGTASSTEQDITGMSGIETFTLNANAITYLESKFGGYADFSARLSGDYAPSTPTGGNLLDAYKGTDGTESNRPRLEFTYTTPLGEGSYSYFL